MIPPYSDFSKVKWKGTILPHPDVSEVNWE